MTSIWYVVLLYNFFVFWFVSFDVIFWICFVFDFCLFAELPCFFLWRRGSREYFASVWFCWHFLKNKTCRFYYFWKCFYLNTKKKWFWIDILWCDIWNFYEQKNWNWWKVFSLCWQIQWFKRRHLTCQLFFFWYKLCLSHNLLLFVLIQYSPLSAHWYSYWLNSADFSQNNSTWRFFLF